MVYLSVLKLSLFPWNIVYKVIGSIVDHRWQFSGLIFEDCEYPSDRAFITPCNFKNLIQKLKPLTYQTKKLNREKQNGGMGIYSLQTKLSK